MASPHLLAFCKEAICVAEDSSVAFYAPQTLKKFRVERLSGLRIAGLFAVASKGGETHLHVFDAEANWFIISLAHIELLSSSTIRWDDEAPAAEGIPVVSTRRPAVTEDCVLEAHVHEAGGALHCVLLTRTGVHEASLRGDAASAARLSVRAARIIAFPGPMPNCAMAVGRATGLVVVVQRGERWAQCSLFDARDARRPQVLEAPVSIQSVACHPLENSAAIGGTRGELVVYPSVPSAHHFAEHWHHTPLTALSFSSDGMSLFTGARESVLLVWNMSSYAHRKIGCGLGPIRSVAPSRDSGAQLLLACAESTLATLDLQQMRPTASIEGVQWSADAACTGLVVSRWMGQPAVVLTGLPNVVRICDPFTQQALYSLPISSQMETIPNPPRHGIQHVGLFSDNRTIVTYEEFGGTALPPLLRFWSYDAAVKRHVEAQTIYSPHCGRVLALCTDETARRVFTLSADAMKCWGQSRSSEANKRGAPVTELSSAWANTSASATPSPLASDMALSLDGSLCLVADDSVHLYSAADLRPGEPWRRVLTLTQSVGLSPLRDLQLLPGARAVAARDSSRVFVWPLSSAAAAAAALVWAPGKGAAVTALCARGDGALLAATDCGDVWEIAAGGGAAGKAVGRVANAATRRIAHMRPLQGDGDRVAAVDSASGFRVLRLTPARGEAAEEEALAANGEKANGGKREDEGDGHTALRRYFADVTREDSAAAAGDAEASVHVAARAASAKNWLHEVLADSAFTAPPMSAVLAGYLRRRVGEQTL